MKVSIITAAKNAASTIRDTLLSVQSQTYPYIEHIVIDGCSIDGTLAIVKEHGARVSAVCSERDSGIYEAFNRGLSMASGDVVAFLNADDFYETNDAVAKVMARFSGQDLDVLFGDVLLVKADDLRSVVRYYRSGSFNPGRLARGFIPAHPATFVRRTLFERCGGFNASYRIAGDFEWLARVFHANPTRYAHIPEVLVRMREGGLSTRGIRSTVRITREIRRACSEVGIPTNYLKLLSRFPEKLIEYIARPSSLSLL